MCFVNYDDFERFEDGGPLFVIRKDRLMQHVRVCNKDVRALTKLRTVNLELNKNKKRRVYCEKKNKKKNDEDTGGVACPG